MPARIHIASVSRTSSNLLAYELSTKPSAARHFSQSTRHNTQQRDEFLQWLAGPGRSFQRPLPGSTNYLSAYLPDGTLRRLRNQTAEAERKPEKEESAATKQDGQNGMSAAENPDDLEAASDKSESAEETQQNKDELEMAAKEDASRGGLPKEAPGDFHPYPLNKYFKSERVLSEETRERIYSEVVEKGVSVVKISADAGVSLERVAAVIRLKTIEKQWQTQGKPLAKAYSRAVLDMLPQTQFTSGKDSWSGTHESITDIPVLPATTRQVFHPVSESRHFTRADAAKVFADHLKPADERMPHQELVLAEKLSMQGLSGFQLRREVSSFAAAQEKQRIEKREKAKAKIEKHTMVVPGRRWDFHIREIKAEDVGRNGRSPRGVGWRYGVPHQDRKRGQIKIPTEVVA